uniref:Plant heme peroxidase family profile domain-containing protein n=1 Tax=Ananas comosus var. bracteatus TaxID=296719 RepID=A0A6V7NRD0_ANACO|nr:unnamed protein product [Ananas comosus var. bracteatus]
MSSKGCSFHITTCFAATVLLLLLSTFSCEAQLTPNYYDYACPQALSTIRAAVRAAIAKERRMAASLIRLHFHDCFVQGCDASLLLDDAPNIVSEKNAFQSFKSLRGFEVIDGVKSAVEEVGGPTWTVKLGRRDSTTANKDLARANLPNATNDLDALVSIFARQGLSVKDMVALSGAHTIA